MGEGAFLTTIGERLREARAATGLSQTAFAELGGVLKGAQIKYESGERFPDASYLAAVAAAGVDVRYVITGKRPEGEPSADEQRLLALYRLAAVGLRKAVVAALAAGEMPVAAPTVIKRGGSTVTIHGQVGHSIDGDQVIHGSQTFNMSDLAPAPAPPPVVARKSRRGKNG